MLAAILLKCNEQLMTLLDKSQETMRVGKIVDGTRSVVNNMKVYKRVNARLEETWNKKKPETTNDKKSDTERVPQNEKTMWY